MTTETDMSDHAAEPVHIVITRRVRPGCEAKFQEGLRDFFQASFGHDGVMGASMIVPSPESGSREFGILRTFTNARERDAFYESALFKAWEDKSAPLAEGGWSYRHLTGMEAWFRSPQRPPARWKMALLTWAAVWPVSLLVRAVLFPVVGDRMPAWLFAGLTAAGIVLVLTWVAMPQLAKAAHRWLQPPVHAVLGPERTTAQKGPK